MSSSASLGFGESNCYNLINSICCAFNFKSHGDSCTKLDHATCSDSHFHTSDSKDFSSFNPEGGD